MKVIPSTPDLGPNPFTSDPYRDVWIGSAQRIDPPQRRRAHRRLRRTLRQALRTITPRFGTGGSRTWK